jgi:hypothetical protein
MIAGKAGVSWLLLSRLLVDTYDRVVNLNTVGFKTASVPSAPLRIPRTFYTTHAFEDEEQACGADRFTAAVGYEALNRPERSLPPEASERDAGTEMGEADIPRSRLEGHGPTKGSHFPFFFHQGQDLSSVDGRGKPCNHAAIDVACDRWVPCVSVQNVL